MSVCGVARDEVKTALIQCDFHGYCFDSVLENHL